MKFYYGLICLFSVVVLMAGCTTTSITTESTNNNFNSTLWIQTASEYKATALQTYNMAGNNIDHAISDLTWTALPKQAAEFSSLPVAVILDVDETVLNNSNYQAQLVEDGVEFDPATWDRWVAMKTARAIPGAVRFINSMIDKGVEVIYITNRECRSRPGSDEACPQKQETMENLKKIGIKTVKPENLLLKSEKPEWLSEKKSRRETVAKKFRVLMLFGDDLGDFLADVKKDITALERDALVEKYESNWGSKWFMFSNPTYGSWQRVLDDPKSRHLQGY